MVFKVRVGEAGGGGGVGGRRDGGEEYIVHTHFFRRTVP